MPETVRGCRHRIRLFIWQLESMPEYSATLPTGTTLWKMWRRNINEPYNYALARNRVRLQVDPAFHGELPQPKPPEWWVGQYTPHDDPDKVGIKWYDVQILEGPMPPGWQAPDWDNYARFKRERAEERAKRSQKNA